MWWLWLSLCQAAPAPWNRDIVAVELVIIQPTVKRWLLVEKKPDVPHAKPIEGAIGHVALRLVDDGPVDEQWLVGMSAFMDLDGDGVDDPSNVWKGMFGGMDKVFGSHIGYDKRLLMMPLDAFADDYAFGQGRWLERYPMPMTEEEIHRLQGELRAAWVASEARELGSYGFWAENCATELTQLLNRAVAHEDDETNYPYTLPNKYRRRGVLAPPVGRVTPAMTGSHPHAENWAAYPGLGRVCGPEDAACVQRWVAEADKLGPDWTAEMVRRLGKKAYRERHAPALRDALAGDVPTDVDRRHPDDVR